jgi:hypothetical protein
MTVRFKITTRKSRKVKKVHEQRELVVAIGEGKDDPMCRKEKKEALQRYAEAFQDVFSRAKIQRSATQNTEVSNLTWSL